MSVRDCLCLGVANGAVLEIGEKDQGMEVMFWPQGSELGADPSDR